MYVKNLAKQMPGKALHGRSYKMIDVGVVFKVSDFKSETFRIYFSCEDAL